MNNDDIPEVAPIATSANIFSRRRAVIGGMACTFAPLAARLSAAQEPTEPSPQYVRHQFTHLQPEREVPSVKLFGLDGKVTDLSALRGKVILVNFWATWCPACLTELPVLDRLFGERHRAGLHVIAISEDRADRTTVERFVQKLGIRSLPIYWDPNGFVAFSDQDNKRNAPFALYGMPITYLISSRGRVVGYMPGAADWRSDAADKLIEHLHRT